MNSRVVMVRGRRGNLPCNILDGIMIPEAINIKSTASIALGMSGFQREFHPRALTELVLEHMGGCRCLRVQFVKRSSIIANSTPNNDTQI